MTEVRNRSGLTQGVSRRSRIFSTFMFSALWGQTRASQIVEFAVSLPLLVVCLVGIFDFGNAFGLKYKLANAVREGARFAASEPTADLSDPTAGASGSVQSVATLVGNYLLASNVFDCGLSNIGIPLVTNTGPRTWTYTKNAAPCPGTLTLVVNRGYTFQTAGGMTVEATKVTLSYPYQWQYNRAFQLLVPGGLTFPSQVTSVAVMPNLN